MEKREKKGHPQGTANDPVKVNGKFYITGSIAKKELFPQAKEDATLTALCKRPGHKIEKLEKIRVTKTDGKILEFETIREAKKGLFPRKRGKFKNLSKEAGYKVEYKFKNRWELCVNNEVKSVILSRRRPAEKDKILTFDPGFYGKKTGKRQSAFEYETYHDLVVSELGKNIKSKYNTKQYTIFDTKLIDLGLQVDGKTRHIFEVKSSSDRQSIYAGIGQLMFHSLGSASVKKTLVLPSGENTKELTELLKEIDIEIIFYEINKGKVLFMTMK